MPQSSIGLRMSDDVVRVALGLRLGSKLCEPHTCHCGVRVSPAGIHGLSCKKSTGRHPRHDLLNDVTYRAAIRAQVPASKAPVGLFRSDGKRPDGVTMVPWSRGRCMAWDVTVPDTLALSHLPGTASRAAATEKAETAKIAKYSALANTHIFIPVAFETLGSWGMHAAGLIDELGRRITMVTGDGREREYLRQRISVAIQRGNAMACHGTLPSDTR